MTTDNLAAPPQTQVRAGPKWSAAHETVPGIELFASRPYTPAEKLTHTAAGVGVVVCWCAAGRVVVTQRRQYRRQPTHAVAAIAAGAYTADLASGVLHWAFDTWFTENSPVVRRVVLIVREHHVYPQRVFNYPLTQDVGIMAPFGLLSLTPVLLQALRQRNSNAHLTLAALTCSVLLTISLDLHKLGHRVEGPALLRAAQRAHLVLSPRWHYKHHAKEHDTHYCLVNGIADATLGRAGLFRGLERLVSATTGAAPRSNDRTWRRRFGRWVSEAPQHHSPRTPHRTKGSTSDAQRNQDDPEPGRHNGAHSAAATDGATHQQPTR